MSARCFIAFALACAACACLGHAAWTREPLVARPELGRVRVDVDPHVATSLAPWSSETSRCGTMTSWFEKTLVDDVRGSLARAGFEVIEDPAAPRDTVASLSATLSRCGQYPVAYIGNATEPDRGEPFVEGNLVLTTDRGARVESRTAAVCASHPDYVDDLAHGLQDAPQIQALAAR